MRKQDRVAASQPQQSRPQQSENESQASKTREQVKGSASQNETQKPPRQPGRMPLPD